MANILKAGVLDVYTIDKYVTGFKGTITLDSTTVTDLVWDVDVSFIIPGLILDGNANIAPGTTIISVDSPTDITISQPATGSEINASGFLNCPDDIWICLNSSVFQIDTLFNADDVQDGWLLYAASEGYTSRSLRFKIKKLSSSAEFLQCYVIYDAPGGISPETPALGRWILCEPSARLQLGSFISTVNYNDNVGSIPFDGYIIQEEEIRRVYDSLSVTGIQGITGLEGLQGITGIMGIDGVTGIMGIDGQTGIQGVTGVLGLQGVTGIGAGETGIHFATELPLGELPGGFSPGIFPWDASTYANPAFDEINSLLLAIAPAPPGPLAGSLVLAGTTKYAAIFPTNLDSTAWYVDGSSAGSLTNDYIIVNSYTLSNANPSTTFKIGSTFTGDEGTVYHVLNNSDYSYRDVTQGVGTSGTIVITDETTYNNIWRKGNARIAYTQPNEGYSKHVMRYQSPTVNQSTSATRFWYDNVNGVPGFPYDSTITQSIIYSNRFLSGVRYYYTGDTFDMTSAITNIAKKGIHPTSPITYSMPGLAQVTLTIPGASFSYDGTYNFAINDALDTANVYNIDARLTITATKPAGTQTVKLTPSQNRLVNTYSPLYSSNCNITMFDEEYRWKTSTDFSVIPANYTDPTGDWTSSDVLTNGNGQLYNSTWYYPRINYTTNYLPNVPAQTANYSGFSGDQTIIWACNIGNAHSSMTIVFTGIAYTAISAEGSGNLNLLIRLPSVTPSFAPTGWMDTGKSFGNGNGCRNDLGSSGGILACTFGTSSSTGSSGTVFIKVVLKNSSAGTASRMQITGT